MKLRKNWNCKRKNCRKKENKWKNKRKKLNQMNYLKKIKKGNN